MSGGVNVKSAPRAPTSGIPLPHSLLPSSPKADLRRRTSNQPRASTESPKHMPSQTPVHSPSPCQQTSGIPAFFSRDHSLKSQLFQRTGGLPVPQTSRSAYSSPITQRRIPPPHSKDTLDRSGKTYFNSHPYALSTRWKQKHLHQQEPNIGCHQPASTASVQKGSKLQHSVSIQRGHISKRQRAPDSDVTVQWWKPSNISQSN